MWGDLTRVTVPAALPHPSWWWVTALSEALLWVGRSHQKAAPRDFPGGTAVRNPPANAGDMGSSPGLGRSHMPWSNWARAPQLLSLCSRAREPQLLKPTCLEPVLHNKRSHRNEKPVHRNEE